MSYPKKIGDVLAQLVARRGYAREQSSAALETAWKQAAGEQIAKVTRVGAIRGGTLEVTVANNLLVQELGFQKVDLLDACNGWRGIKKLAIYASGSAG